MAKPIITTFEILRLTTDLNIYVTIFSHEVSKCCKDLLSPKEKPFSVKIVDFFLSKKVVGLPEKSQLVSKKILK